MDEYASMRLRFDCAMAITLPAVMVTAATAHSRTLQSGCAARSATVSTRMSAAKAAALEPVAMSAVTDVGAPSETAGAPMWEGTGEILEPKPTRSKPRPDVTTG